MVKSGRDGHSLLVNPVLKHDIDQNEANYIYIYIYYPIDLEARVFANGSRDRGSIPGRVISKTQTMVLDTALLYSTL